MTHTKLFSLHIYIPYHDGSTASLLKVVSGIDHQAFSVEVLDNVAITIDIIANGNSGKIIPEGLASKKFPLYYNYFPEIKNAAGARSKGAERSFSKGTGKSKLFLGHDIDDSYTSENSVNSLLEEYVKETTCSISFGDVNFTFAYADKEIFEKSYENFVHIKDAIDFSSSDNKMLGNKICKYIAKTAHFPTQATIYRSDIAKKIGWFPQIVGLEDRIFTIKYIQSLIKKDMRICYTNKKLVDYKIHKGSETVRNTKSGLRKANLSKLEQWLKMVSSGRQIEIYEFFS